MSILIKGMGMPSECKECQMCVYYMHTGGTICHATGEVLAKNFQPIAFENRHKDCPLVELPEKHGCLVDADALIAKYGDWYTEEGTETGFIGTLEMLLKDAPTVVEAEGEEEENDTV